MTTESLSVDRESRTRRGRRNSPAAAGWVGRRTSWLLAAPFLVLLLIGLILPVGTVLWDSLALPSLSFAAYEQMLTDSLVIEVLVRTFRIAAIVTLVTLVVGYVLAVAAWRGGRTWGRIILLVVSFPVLTSLVTRNYAWIILLGRNGPVNELLMAVGIINEPLRLLNTETAVIIGMIHVMIPFAVLPIYNALNRIEPSVLRASASLGASPLHTLRRVTLPLSAPGGVVAAVFVFVLSLGFFVTPALLGGPSNMMAANIIDKEANFFLNFDGAAAIAAALLAITIVILGIASTRVDLSRVIRS